LLRKNRSSPPIPPAYPALPPNTITGQRPLSRKTSPQTLKSASLRPTCGSLVPFEEGNKVRKILATQGVFEAVWHE
jgi:hypothetical protein